ncbi:hypothetical protein L484_015062 [Morus notabilis]|uniref:Uncharacterized protein n=1 Tax=Morus notabilis TaxID=981085 RepID=W9SVS3_9ROSA|nr:hypothetical protein L484_015062 [Morus notabilis]
MAISQFLLFFLFPAFSSSLLFSLSQASVTSENDCFRKLQELKLKIAHLELKFDETIRNLNEKELQIEEQEKLIQQMSNEIHLLQSSVLSLKSELQRDSSGANERLNALEEEVRLLWAAARKNNFDIHVLKSKAQDAEDKLETVASQAEKMADIVTEHWIQIQRLEQALHITQLIDRLFGDHPQKVLGVLDSFTLQLKRVFAVATEYHHELETIVAVNPLSEFVQLLLDAK